MKVCIKNTSKKHGLDHDDVMDCDNPFDVCDGFLDEESGSVYFPAIDVCNGPFWIQLDKQGVMSAWAPSNLPLEGSLLEIQPKIIVEY